MTTTNALKTAFLLAMLSGLLLFGGSLLAGRQGLYIALFMAVAMNFTGYFFSDKIALSMYRAQRVSETENPEVYRRIYPMTQQLCQRMGIPVPKLWLIPEGSPNAFATGRNPKNASVAVTFGLLQLMNDSEVEGVIAHELGHVKNRDILISSVAATIAAAITSLGYMALWFRGGRDQDNSPAGAIGGLLLLMLGPLAAGLIQMAISRTREFSADHAAAQYTGTPYGLISALKKLESYSKRIPMEASAATAHMFIIKPVSGQAMAKLFSTHPPTEERVARLQAIR
jgi:heat shock protein HtpX